MEARIGLQRTRFSLIEGAAGFDDDEGTPMSRRLIDTKLEMLEQNWNRFKEEHENLCLSESSSLNGHEYVSMRLYERCQAFYIYSRAKLLMRRDQITASDTRSPSVMSDRGTRSTLLHVTTRCLPRITLPSFSGDYQSWRTFSDLFTSLIRENPSLSVVERMHYLKTCLSEEAARLVSNLPISDNNFIVAWELLVARYENKRFLITAHLDRITNLKPMKTKSAKGLSQIFSTVSEALGALRALGCAVQYWDPLLLHSLTRLLDAETREAWEVTLGSSSTCPTYQQFEKFIIARSRALENVDLHNPSSGTHRDSNLFGTRQKVTVHAATLDSQSNPANCPLCDSPHYLAKCARYLAKTPQQRREIIMKHKKCFNCLGAHTASRCNNLRRCLRCGKKHHTTIHHDQNKPVLQQSSTTPTSEIDKQIEETTKLQSTSA